MGSCLSTKRGVLHIDQEAISENEHTTDVLHKGQEAISENEHTEVEKSINESDNLSIASSSEVSVRAINESSAENFKFEQLDQQGSRKKRRKRKAKKKKSRRLYDRKCVVTIADKFIEPDAKELILKVRKSCFNLTHMSLDCLKENKGSGIDSIIIFQTGGANGNRGQDIIGYWREQIPNVISMIIVCIGIDVREDQHGSTSCQDKFEVDNDILIEYHINLDTKLPLNCSVWKQMDIINLCRGKTVKHLRGTIIERSETLGAVDQIVIIVCGGTGHGKSSLINNCMAALKGSYSTITKVGRGPEQITKQYKQFQSVTMDDGRVRKLPLIFADTRGLCESKREGASVAAIQACIMGKVVNGETIDSNITEKEWRERKPVKSKVSYIFFVVDATVIGGEAKGQTLIRNLREIREFAKAEDIPVSAFVTKCDNLDPAVKDDPSILHYSKAVQGVVTVFSPMIDVEINRVFPVVNYTNQCNPSNEMMIQTLLALKNCMEDILGDIHSHIDKKLN